MKVSRALTQPLILLPVTIGRKPFTSCPVIATKFCVLPNARAENVGASYTKAKSMGRQDRPGEFGKPTSIAKGPRAKLAEGCNAIPIVNRALRIKLASSFRYSICISLKSEQTMVTDSDYLCHIGI